LLSSYDESFAELIKKLRPDWFIKPSDIMKKKIIKIAKSNKNKPKNKTKERDALNRYTDKNSSSYDEFFTKLIKKLRPDWFIRSVDAMKQVIINMAKSGKNRPDKKTKEGQSLERYINQNSNCYDENFKKTIKKLRPDWFRKKITVEEKVFSIIKQNPGINAGGLYELSFGNINAGSLNATLEKLRKEDTIHFKIVNSKMMGRYSQKWYPSSQTKEKKEISDIWVNIKEIQEEIQKYFVQSKLTNLIKIKKIIQDKLKKLVN
jgi:hypothetical protein